MPYSALQLAEAYLQAGELDEAIEALNQHIAATPDDPSRRLRASILSRQPQTDALQQALGDLDALATSTPQDAILRSTIHQKLGDDVGALEVVLTAHDRFPEDDRLTERCLYLLRMQGKIKEARALVATLQKNWRWSQWAGDLARDDHALEDAVTHYSAAIDMLDTLYALDARTPAGILKNDAMDEAIALTIMAVYARLRAVRGDIYEQSGDETKADEDFAIAQSILPDDPLIVLSRALLAAKQGAMDTAKDRCAEALTMASDSLRQTYVLPRIYASPYSELHALADRFS
ncbi:MAG: tetratricopeptide repeat protein [Aggregatilineales bacterium]